MEHQFCALTLSRPCFPRFDLAKHSGRPVVSKGPWQNGPRIREFDVVSEQRVDLPFGFSLGLIGSPYPYRFQRFAQSTGVEFEFANGLCLSRRTAIIFRTATFGWHRMFAGQLFKAEEFVNTG